MAVSIQASHLFTSHLYKTNPSLQTRLNDTADWCNEAGAEDRNKEPNQSVLLPRSTHQMSKIGNGLNLFLVFTRTCVSAPGLKREQMNSCFFSCFFFLQRMGTFITEKNILVQRLDATMSVFLRLCSEHKRAWLCEEIALFAALGTKKHRRFYSEVYGGIKTPALKGCRGNSFGFNTKPVSEREITHHAGAVVGHILCYLMAYSLLCCRSAGKKNRSHKWSYMRYGLGGELHWSFHSIHIHGGFNPRRRR